jgi:hypothetical protein
MRAVLATAVAAFAAAAPAAAFSVPHGVSLARSGTAPQATASHDKSRSCQAGSQKPLKLINKTRHQRVVACEQPPRSNPLTPDSVAKATAAALSVLG